MSADARAAALAVMEAHLSALNAGDGAALARTLHFPHYRLAGGRMRVWEAEDDYLAEFRRRAGPGWARSEWGRIEVLRAEPGKVHLDVEVRRYGPGGDLIASFASLWVIARLGGVWAAQLRSSFAEDPGAGGG